MRAYRPGRFKQFIVAVALALAGWGATAPAALASLSQAYATSIPIPDGSLVALDTKSSGSVVAADLNNSDRLFGVAVPPSSASISLGGANPAGQVQVVTTGSANVLVSTAGGDIHVGDYISISPITGVGQKAVGKIRVIGTAQADFNGNGGNTTKRTIDVGGTKKEVAIGQIPVVISVATINNDNGQTYTVPGWLQNFSNALAGKNVSPIRIIMAGLILLVSLVTITVLLYSAVRNSIISIGRNPLSRGSVLRGLLEVILISVGILVVATVAMYLVISR